jgi:hypothetical protein
LIKRPAKEEMLAVPVGFESPIIFSSTGCHARRRRARLVIPVAAQALGLSDQWQRLLQGVQKAFGA